MPEFTLVDAKELLTVEAVSDVCDRVRRRCIRNTSEHDFEFWFLNITLGRFPGLDRYLFIENYDTDAGQLPDVVIGETPNRPELCIEFSEKGPAEHVQRLKKYCERYGCLGYHVYFKDVGSNTAPIRQFSDGPIIGVEVPIALPKKDKTLNDDRVGMIFEIPYAPASVSCIIKRSRFSALDKSFESEKEAVRLSWSKQPMGKEHMQGQLARINRIAPLIQAKSQGYFRIGLKDARTVQGFLDPRAREIIREARS
jgi:hypothetical protein